MAGNKIKRCFVISEVIDTRQTMFAFQSFTLKYQNTIHGIIATSYVFRDKWR